MKKTTVLAFAVAVLAAVGGCAFQVESEVVQRDPDRDRPSPADVAPVDDVTPDTPVPADEPSVATPLPPWDASRPFRGLADGRIRGAIGTSVALDLQADLADVYDDGYFSQIDVYALRNDGMRVMLQLQVQNGAAGPLLQPGVGMRARLGGRSDGGYLYALGCEGPDGTDAPFEDTPFDEEPCDVGVDTEQNPESPDELLVTLAATFADDNGDCPDLPGDGGDGVDLPDGDGDGDGDLPGTDVPSDDTAYPLAVTTFRLTR